MNASSTVIKGIVESLAGCIIYAAAEVCDAYALTGDWRGRVHREQREAELLMSLLPLDTRSEVEVGAGSLTTMFDRIYAAGAENARALEEKAK